MYKTINIYIKKSLSRAYVGSEQAHRKNFMFKHITIKVVNIFDFVILVNNLH